MISPLKSVHFHSVGKLISILIVIIPLINCNSTHIDPLGNLAGNGTTEEPKLDQSNNSKVINNNERGNLGVDLNEEKADVTGFQMPDTLRSFLNSIPNYSIVINPVVKFHNETDFNVTMVTKIIHSSNNSSPVIYPVDSMNMNQSDIRNMLAGLHSELNDLKKAQRSENVTLDNPPPCGVNKTNNENNNDTNVRSNNDTRDSIENFNNQTSSSFIVSNLVNLTSSVNDTKTTPIVSEAIVSTVKTNVTSSISTTTSLPLVTRAVSPLTSTSSPVSETPTTSKPDPKLNSLIDELSGKVNFKLRPVPETVWTPEGLKPNNQSSRINDIEINNERRTENNQIKPETIKPIDPLVIKQIERLLHHNTSNQRQAQPQPQPQLQPQPQPQPQLQPQPIQPMIPDNIYKHPLPPQPNGQYNYNKFNNNQNTGNIINTRGQNVKIPNPSPPVNVRNNVAGQYQRPIIGHYQPRQNNDPSVPYAVEEIVHSQSPRINQRDSKEMEPELFVKIIRHYFTNTLTPSVTKRTFIRQAPKMLPLTVNAWRSQLVRPFNYRNN